MKDDVNVLCLLVLFLSLLSAQPAGSTVQTSSGPITGHVAKNRPDVSEYLGIPYAEPPTGDLRFAAPESYKSSDPITADAYSPDCPQQGLTAPPVKFTDQTPRFKSIIEAFAGGRGNELSEDCLTLNIWTKGKATSQANGVLVWFHGGRFTLGDTNTPFYTGEYLASAQDIVVVTVNYRLNMFGFSGAPGQPMNAGLLDQRKAVEWVRDNIAAFGGDNRRITIMGQSAGGSAVDMYAYAYASDPIVAGLISHSGTSLSFEANTPDFARQSFLTAATNVSCTGSDEETVACMRQVGYQELLAAIGSVKPLPSVALAQPVFHPTVDNVIIFDLATYRSKGSAGDFAKLPYLAGFTNHESGFYRLAATSQKIDLTTEQWDLYELEGFICATRDAVAYRTRHGVPAYRFRYFGEWPNLQLYPDSGSYHGSDLHMIFGASQDVTGIPPTQQQAWTTEYMQRAWAAFVNDPEYGLEHMTWPTHTGGMEGDHLVRLGWEGNPAASYISAEPDDERCPSNRSVKEAQGAF